MHSAHLNLDRNKNGMIRYVVDRDKNGCTISRSLSNSHLWWIFDPYLNQININFKWYDKNVVVVTFFGKWWKSSNHESTITSDHLYWAVLFIMVYLNWYRTKFRNKTKMPRKRNVFENTSYSIEKYKLIKVYRKKFWFLHLIVTW